jgi:O-antigen/teichoic acid export membrane protein
MIAALKSKTAQKIASNTIYQIVGKFITMSVTILITIIITRTYGREGYGEFNLMQVYPALFFIIVDFGFNAIATRELSSDWKKADEYFSNILSIRLLMSTLLVIFFAVALYLFPYSPQLIFGIQLGLLAIIAQALYATTNTIFQVKLRYDYSTIGLISGYLLILLLSLFLALKGAHVMWINFTYVLGGILTFFVNLYFVKKFGIKISLAFDKTLWKYLFVQAFPLGLMFVFSQINFRSDSLLLSVLTLPNKFHLNNTESVAIYGLPYKIFEVSLVLPTFFMNSVYPVFVRHMNEGSKKLKTTFLNSMKALLLMGIFVGVFGYLFSPFVISLLGGDEFKYSVDVLRILLLGVSIFYITQPLSWLVVTLGKQIYLPYIYFISALINLVMNYYLIPRYSFYASSYLTWLSESLIFIMLIFAARKAWKQKFAYEK